MESKQTPKQRRKDIGLVVLSAIDVLTGILSLVFATLAVQVIAIMSSGLTLFKAVKVAVQSEKTAILVKPVALYAVRRLSRSENMKAFFKKVKENLKNNPLTTLFSIVELVLCGGLGYALIDFVARFPWAIGWKLYVIAFGIAAVIYAILLTFTIRLGHDNIIFATIRRLVKNVGGDKAVEVLDATYKEVTELAKEEEARKAAEEAAAKERAEREAAAQAAIEEKKKKEAEILAYAEKREEEEKKEAERRALIDKYKAEYEQTHPTENEKN